MIPEHIPAYASLSETEKKKLQKQFHNSDLDYLASYAVESGSLAASDLEELYTRIDESAAGKTPAWLNGFMLVLCGMLIGGSVFFMIFRTQQTHASHEETVAVPAPAEIKTTASSATNSLPVATEQTNYSKEHFSIHHPAGEGAVKKETYDELEPKQLDAIEVSAAENNPPVLIDLESIPNAPVIYIADLKVAGYRQYYFKNDQGFVPGDNGLPAEFADRKTAADPNENVLAEKNYYAHEIIKDAMVLFHKKNYGACTGLLRSLYNHNKNDVNAQFYLGMSYYYLGDNSTAIRYFNEVLANDINVFKQEAEFYKAVSLFDSKNTEEAAQLLKIISAKHSFYGTRADELLRTLK